ncbi:hypothetical protein [Paludibacterium denitrificans]|uniref:Uncharacterized protein n=1 Tax=Paludibacterium denitrificans TaxID=2675226 RepID=A0A844GGN4_9NEIS|nr:hypothetical protein [Paludibacterium denitrificans]MTD34047.1 hypothetical protein [Paludibacterium denitrificans]
MIWIAKNWKWLAALVAVAGLIALGVEMRGIADRPALASAKADASAARGVTEAVQAARVIEHKVAASDAEASAQYQKGLEDGKTELQGAVDRLNAALRLRDAKLTAARAGNLSAAATGSSRRDASAPTDFLAAHGSDALRLAAEADDVTKQLTACQAIVASDRAVP